MKVRAITCERCSASMDVIDDIPELPAAKAWDCTTCHALLIVWRDLAGDVRCSVATRTGQATA